MADINRIIATARRDSRCVSGAETRALCDEIERLTADLKTARDTNRRLNGRCQAAEKAMGEYKRMVALPPDGDGIRFVRGSFGRALLAYECDRQDREIERLRQLLGMQRELDEKED